MLLFFKFFILSDIKSASLISICLINFMQAKLEGTINVNMSAQTVLSKMPKSNSPLLPPLNVSEINNDTNSFNLNRNDHEIYFKPLFALVINKKNFLVEIFS
jgi:hypothetical protein